MVSPRALLLGSDRDRSGTALDLLFAAALWFATLLAYAVGLFEVTGGVVFLPADAATVGLVAAALVGYRRGGLVVAWVVAYAPLLGVHADHALLGLSGRALVARIAYFLQPDGLAYWAVLALVVGTLGFAAGTVSGWALRRVRGDAAAARSG